jgi:hypothetical protein
MKNRIIFIAVTFLILTLFSGCDIGVQPAYARIEVYAADNQTLICEIEDKTVLDEFNRNTAFAEDMLALDEDEYHSTMEDIKEHLEEMEPQYIIISYKTPTSASDDEALEKISEIAVYKDTNMIKEQVSGSVSSEYITSYYNVSSEKKDFLASLVGEGLVSGESAFS